LGNELTEKSWKNGGEFGEKAERPDKEENKIKEIRSRMRINKRYNFFFQKGAVGNNIIRRKQDNKPNESER